LIWDHPEVWRELAGEPAAAAKPEAPIAKKVRRSIATRVSHCRREIPSDPVLRDWFDRLLLGVRPDTVPRDASVKELDAGLQIRHRKKITGEDPVSRAVLIH
jgi:hypothetical protein